MGSKLNNRSLISIEVFVLAVIVAISMTTTSVLHNRDITEHTNAIAQNTHAISEIQAMASKVIELSKD